MQQRKVLNIILVDATKSITNDLNFDQVPINASSMRGCISFATQNGFPKLESVIVLLLIYLQITSPFATLIPCFGRITLGAWNSKNMGGPHQKCDLAKYNLQEDKRVLRIEINNLQQQSEVKKTWEQEDPQC